jgi:hypothetical protein
MYCSSRFSNNYQCSLWNRYTAAASSAPKKAPIVTRKDNIAANSPRCSLAIPAAAACMVLKFEEAKLRMLLAAGRGKEDNDRDATADAVAPTPLSPIEATIAAAAAPSRS